MARWSAPNVVGLLLAVTRGREHLQPETLKEVLESAGVALPAALPDLAAADMVKLVLAVSGLGASDLLDVVAKETAIRLSDFSLPNLLLVTQGLVQGLDPSHEALWQVLGFWPEKLVARPAGPGAPVERGLLSTDQLIKLAVAAFPV